MLISCQLFQEDIKQEKVDNTKVPDSNNRGPVLLRKKEACLL